MMVKFTTHLNSTAQQHKQHLALHTNTLVETNALSSGHLPALHCLVLENAKKQQQS